MENNNQNTELELMRSQMEDFKAQLDKQKIVNEKMIIGSMKKSMSWIKRYVYFECCLVPIIAGSLSRSSPTSRGSTTPSS